MFLRKKKKIVLKKENKRLPCFLAMGLLFLFSCNSSVSEKEQMVKSLADLECRAIELKNKRFELANQIRFAQDTLLQTKTTTDTVSIQNRLKDWETQKQLIVNQSLNLADSIKLQMQIIMPRYFTDKEKEKEFNLLLDAALKENGCK